MAVPFPSRVTVELTNGCNLSCPVCPRHLMEGKLGNMSFDLYKKIIDEIAKYPDTVLIPFFRGESMLHKQFVEMLAYARDKGVGKIQLTTNATRMKPKFARAIIDYEVDFVSFSVDTVDPDDYAKVRKGGVLKETLKNIEYFCDYKKQTGQTKTEVQVSVVRSDTTSAGVDQFVAYWKPKVDRVRVFEQHTGDGNFGSVAAAREKFIFDKRMPCLKLFDEISIYWNGQAALCCHDWDRTSEIGDISKNSIAEVWKNEIYRQMRENHISHPDKLGKLCQNCDQWQAYYLPQSVGAIGELHLAEAKTGMITV